MFNNYHKLFELNYLICSQLKVTFKRRVALKKIIEKKFSDHYFYYNNTESTQINHHLSFHLSQPIHLPTQPKTTTGADKEPTIYE